MFQAPGNVLEVLWSCPQGAGTPTGECYFPELVLFSALSLMLNGNILSFLTGISDVSSSLGSVFWTVRSLQGQFWAQIPADRTLVQCSTTLIK